MKQVQEPSERIGRLCRNAEAYKTPGTISDEEHAMIKEVILLPLLQMLVERDRKHFADPACTRQFAKLYEEQAIKLWSVIQSDLTALRKELRRREIKTYLELKDENGIRYLYTHRGYQSRMALSWNLIRAELQVRKAEYGSMLTPV